MQSLQRLVPVWLPAGLLLLSGCSSPPPETKPAASVSPYGPGPASATGKHPLAKYIELSGFRLTLGAGNQLKIKFTAINHSDADLEELGVHVRIVTSVAKPGDPPVAEFDAKIPELGPQETHDINATATTTMKAYELPDWQFLRADFDITSPAP
jgi:hypothetical protein